MNTEQREVCYLERNENTPIILLTRHGLVSWYEGDIVLPDGKNYSGDPVFEVYRPRHPYDHGRVPSDASKD